MVGEVCEEEDAAVSSAGEHLLREEVLQVELAVFGVDCLESRDW